MPDPTNPLTEEDRQTLKSCCKDCGTARGLAQRMKAAGMDVEDKLEMIDQIEREALLRQSIFFPLDNIPELEGS